jgi:hypothetical protein
MRRKRLMAREPPLHAQGADDRGRESLSGALEKLPLESPAAQRIEAELPAS